MRMERLTQIEGIYVSMDHSKNRAGLVTFNLGDVHPHDVATVWMRKALLFVQVIIAASRLCDG